MTSFMKIAAEAVREEAMRRMRPEALSPLGVDGRFVVRSGDQLIGNLRTCVDEVLAELCDCISRSEL